MAVLETDRARSSLHCGIQGLGTAAREPDASPAQLRGLHEITIVLATLQASYLDGDNLSHPPVAAAMDHPEKGLYATKEKGESHGGCSISVTWAAAHASNE